MNKKNLALVGVLCVAVALISSIATVTFYQFLMSNTNVSNATVKADSFQLQIQAFIANGEVDFSYIPTQFFNSTITANELSPYTNYTKVSETTFLNYLLQTGYNENSETRASCIRIDNTFYLHTGVFKEVTSPNNLINWVSVQYTP